MTFILSQGNAALPEQPTMPEAAAIANTRYGHITYFVMTQQSTYYSQKTDVE